ncbi:Uncharacterised protein [Vibrio cholerae]|nr:Uncharacterised protein [Vibrio cholerae]
MRLRLRPSKASKARFKTQSSLKPPTRSHSANNGSQASAILAPLSHSFFAPSNASLRFPVCSLAL